MLDAYRHNHVRESHFNLSSGYGLNDSGRDTLEDVYSEIFGTEDSIEVDLYTEERKTGDRWLVCSDGLYGQMSRRILQELAMLENPEEAADRLLQTALENGGKDNISLVLVQDDTSFPDDQSGTEPSGENASEEVKAD